MMRGVTGAIAAALCVLAAVLGFGLGRDKARVPSETAAIERAAAQYLSEAGPDARPENCAANLATRQEIWIEVVCVRRDGARFVYPVGPDGAVVSPQLPQT